MSHTFPSKSAQNITSYPAHTQINKQTHLITQPTRWEVTTIDHQMQNKHGEQEKANKQYWVKMIHRVIINAKQH